MGKIFEQGSPTVFKLHWNTGLHVLRGSNCRALDCFQKIRGCSWNGHSCDSLIVSYANMPVFGQFPRPATRQGDFQDLYPQQDAMLEVQSQEHCKKTSLVHQQVVSTATK